MKNFSKLSFITLLCLLPAAALRLAAQPDGVSPSQRSMYDEYENCQKYVETVKDDLGNARKRKETEEQQAAETAKKRADADKNAQILDARLNEKDKQLAQAKATISRQQAKLAAETKANAALEQEIQSQDSVIKSLELAVNLLKGELATQRQLAKFYELELIEQNNLVRTLKARVYELEDQVDSLSKRLEEHERLNRIFGRSEVFITAFPANKRDNRAWNQDKWDHTATTFELRPAGNISVPVGWYYLEILDANLKPLPRQEVNPKYPNSGNTFQANFEYKGGVHTVGFDVYGSKKDGTLSGEKFYASITYIDKNIEPPIYRQVGVKAFYVKQKD